MSEWNDDVFNDAEAEEDRQRRKDMRRAILGGAAGVAMLIGPIVLANAVVPDDTESDVKAEDETATSRIAALKNREAARESDLARAGGALSMRTTTTPPPPPPETTTTVEETTTTTVEETTTTSEAPVEEEEPPPSSGGGLGDPYDHASWDALAECESGGNWSINTGNGYYGGLQFSLSSWRGVGGTGYPHEHSRETQIEMGIRLWESSGWGAWPACTRELGWR